MTVVRPTFSRSAARAENTLAPSGSSSKLLYFFEYRPARVGSFAQNIHEFQSLRDFLASLTLTLVMLIGFSSMAGVIGGGGLGDLAIRYGYQGGGGDAQGVAGNGMLAARDMGHGGLVVEGGFGRPG